MGGQMGQQHQMGQPQMGGPPPDWVEGLTPAGLRAMFPNASQAAVDAAVGRFGSDVHGVNRAMVGHRSSAPFNTPHISKMMSRQNDEEAADEAAQLPSLNPKP